MNLQPERSETIAARQWNNEGRRTDNGAEYRGPNISRDVRKWQGER